MKLKKIKIPVYNVNLYLVLTKDISKAARKLFNDSQDESRYSMLAIQGQTGKHHVFCVIVKKRKRITLSSLSHEAVHIAYFIFDYLHIEDNEAFSYLAGYIIDQLYKFLKIPHKWKL